MNTKSFTGLAKDYNQSRPSYPKTLYEAIVLHWQACNPFNQVPTIVDVGCGTGISTRAFYQMLNGHCQITGVELNDDMRQTAIIASPEIEFKAGNAEKIPAVDQSIDIVTAAQAAQWFDRPKFYQEVKRVLKLHGVIAIYENNRDWQRSPFLEKHEEFLEQYAVDDNGEKYSRSYRDINYESELAENFNDAQTCYFHWARKMAVSAFITMAKSSTQVQKAIKQLGEEAVDRLLSANANNHSDALGNVEVLYQTKLYMAQKF